MLVDRTTCLRGWKLISWQGSSTPNDLELLKKDPTWASTSPCYISPFFGCWNITDSLVGQLTTPEHPRDVAGAAKGSTYHHIDDIDHFFKSSTYYHIDDIDDFLRVAPIIILNQYYWWYWWFFEEEHLPSPKASVGPRAQNPSGRL